MCCSLVCVSGCHFVVVVCCVLLGVCRAVLCVRCSWFRCLFILRVDMLRLTLRVVADMCCDGFVRCVVRC